MERHALLRYIQRQRQFAQYILPHQPLSAFISKHNPLPRRLGLPTVSSVNSASNDTNGDQLMNAMKRRLPTSNELSSYWDSDKSADTISWAAVEELQAKQVQQDAEGSDGQDQLVQLVEDASQLQQYVEPDNGDDRNVVPELNASPADNSGSDVSDTTRSALNARHVQQDVENNEKRDQLVRAEAEDVKRVQQAAESSQVQDSSALVSVDDIEEVQQEVESSGEDYPPVLEKGLQANQAQQEAAGSNRYNNSVPVEKLHAKNLEPSLEENGKNDKSMRADVEDAGGMYQEPEGRVEHNPPMPAEELRADQMQQEPEGNDEHNRSAQTEVENTNLVQQNMVSQGGHDKPRPTEVIHARRRKPLDHTRDASHGSSNDRLTDAINHKAIGNKTKPGDQQVNRVQSEADALFAPRETPRSAQEWLDMLRHSRWGDIKTEAHSMDGLPPDKSGVAAINRALRDSKAGYPANSQNLVQQASEPGFFANPQHRVQRDAEQGYSATQQHQVSARMEMGQEDQLAFDRAEPLSMHTRRFLRPLVGFDPVNVRVHRGPAAARLAAAHRADAVTMGNDIALGAGYPENNPETLGLLAHELTHVARHYEPRFVPPVVSGRRTRASVLQISEYGQPQGPLTAPHHPLPLPLGTALQSDHAQPQEPHPLHLQEGATSQKGAESDEEPVALRVEQQVTRLAREKSRNTHHDTPDLIGHASAAEQTTAYQANGKSNAEPSITTQQASWGGLPAPWEPLPDWFVSTLQTTEQRAYTPEVASQAQPSTAHMNIGSNGMSSLPATVAGNNIVQRAGLERSQNALQANQPEQSYESNAMQNPEPDLDELAQQVYGLLKRRLGVERRRMS